MTGDRRMEERKHRRISLKENDGVYCFVVRALTAGKTVTLPAMDFSETGFRFSIVSNMIKDFFEGERIYLKAIAGSRNLTFKDPLELEIKWRKYASNKTWVLIGCEIIAISAKSKMQFLKFIEAEEKFRGISGQTRLNGGNPRVDLLPGSKEYLHIPSRKVLTVSGGSPQNRSLQRVLNWVEDELRTSGHHVERINLIAKTVKGCDACGYCSAPGNESGCIQRDDVPSIIDKLVGSDAAIWASPLYCCGFSSQLKALIDRCHHLLGRSNGTPQQAPSINGQRQALIVTTSDRFDNNAEPLLSMFSRMTDRYKTRSAGVLFVCNCSNPTAMGEDIKAQSIRLAKNLFGSPGSPYPVFIPGDGNQTGQ
jgi:multimeric flavodoxin WrbA